MRLSSLSPTITEFLFALEIEDQLVCTDADSNYPEAAKDLPKLLEFAEIKTGHLFESGADLFLFCGPEQEERSKECQAAGLSVSHFNPQSINGIYEVIRSLGLLLQVEEKAEEVVLHMQQGLNDVKKKAGLLPQRLKVIDDPARPWVAEVIRIAGGEPVPDTDALNLDQLCDPSFLAYPSLRLVDAAQRMFGKLFEVTH